MSGAHDTGKLTFPAARKSPGSRLAAHFPSRNARRLQANPTRTNMRWGDRTIREATLVLMRQIRNWRSAARKATYYVILSEAKNLSSSSKANHGSNQRCFAPLNMTENSLWLSVYNLDA